MKDFLGRELAQEDKIVFIRKEGRSAINFNEAMIYGFTAKMVKVSFIDRWGRMETTRCHPEKCLKV